MPIIPPAAGAPAHTPEAEPSGATARVSEAEQAEQVSAAVGLWLGDLLGRLDHRVRAGALQPNDASETNALHGPLVALRLLLKDLELAGMLLACCWHAAGMLLVCGWHAAGMLIAY